MLTRALIIIALLAALVGCGGGGNSDTSTPAPSVDSVEDSDGDGLSDNEEETERFSDPNDPDDPVRFGQFDHDTDGLPNGADPDYNGAEDSDNDGLSNDWEYSNNLNPGAEEILLTQTRYFSTVTPEYSWIKLALKNPLGEPIAGAAFSITTDNPALLRAIYPAKGWISNEQGIIEAPIIALGTGRSNLYLYSTDRPDQPLIISDLDSSTVAREYNPNDTERSFSSVKAGSSPGSGNAQSRLQSASAWTPASKTSNEWIELPIEPGTRVNALLMQGRANAAHWVTEVKISYEIAPGHREYANDGRVFFANSDRNTAVRIPFNAPPGIDRVRIHLVDWFLTPAMRVALEVDDHAGPTAINSDSDGDGFNDLLEQRIGSDPDDNNSPQLYNPPATERLFSSIETGIGFGQDGADGQIDGAAWRAAITDNNPWMQLSLPSDSKLVGLRLQGDNTTDSWVQQIGYADASIPGLLPALLDGTTQLANDDANTAVNRWLPEQSALTAIRLQPRTWQSRAGLRAGLWLVQRRGTVDIDPLFSDIDGDGLVALQEHALQLSDANADVDGDGLDDGFEHHMGSDPASGDADMDGLPDQIELLLNSDPADAGSPGLGSSGDSDSDGFSDAFELAVLNSNPALADSDADGLDDKTETEVSYSDPLSADSDADSLSDGEEVAMGSNPNLADSPVANPTLDSDGDGINNAREAQQGTPPERRDSDGDGLLDGEEYNLGSDPSDPNSPLPNGAQDSDGDGRSDAREQADGDDALDPNDPVAHGDLDLDADNRPNGSDPDYHPSGDLDGDGIANEQEYNDISDPRDANSPVLGGAFDHDADGIANGADPDFSPASGIDSDGDGLDDDIEYTAGQSAVDAYVPWVGGAQDLDLDTLKNNLDDDYSPTGDDDGDGWSNEFEYRAGTDPTLSTAAVEFVDPVLISSSATTSVVQIVDLPSPGQAAPFYSSSPSLLPYREITASASLAITRELHQGFSSDDISYRMDAGKGYIDNNTPRRFRDLGLRDKNDGSLTRVRGDILPFSRHQLSAPVAGDPEPIDPNPLRAVDISAFQALNLTDGSSRVDETLLDDLQRMAVSGQALLNHPQLWQSYNDYSNSSCVSAICNSPSLATEQLARLFYHKEPLEVALLDPSAERARLSWENKLALHPGVLNDHTVFYKASALSLGAIADSGILEAFASALNSTPLYNLSAAEQRGSSWPELGVYYQFSSDAATRTITLHHYSDRRFDKLYLFSEDPGSDLLSVRFDSERAEFQLQLSQAQWDTGRLAIALNERGGQRPATALLQWQPSPSSWPAEGISCPGAAAAPCSD